MTNRHALRRFAQKYFCLVASVLLFAAAPIIAQAAGEPTLGPNLVKNGGLENGATGWRIPEGTAKVISDAAHSGTHSLYYINTDEKRYKIPNVRLIH
jgi:hypothetical protein